MSIQSLCTFLHTLHTHVYTHGCTHIHTHVYIHGRTHIHTHVYALYTSIYMCIHMCINMLMDMPIHMSIHMRVHMCIHMSIPMSAHLRWPLGTTPRRNSTVAHAIEAFDAAHCQRRPSVHILSHQRACRRRRPRIERRLQGSHDSNDVDALGQPWLQRCRCHRWHSASAEARRPFAIGMHPRCEKESALGWPSVAGYGKGDDHTYPVFGRYNR